MALSGTYYGPWLGSGYQRVYLTWSATQNVANNTSTITASLVWENNAAVALSSSVSKTASITIDGTTYYGSGTVGIAAKTVKTIMTASKTIAHNADGTRSFSISGAFDIKFTLGGTYYASTSASGTGTLNVIPRATTPTLSSGSVTIGNAVTINTPRASGSFLHVIYYKVGSGNWVTIATNVATSYAWTVPMALCSSFPNSPSGKITILVETYNGGTYIGGKTIELTVNIPSSVVPTVSIGKSGVDLYSSKYVQGKSKVAVTITAAGSYGSSIVSRYTTVKSGSNTISSSSAASFTSGVLNYSGTINIATTVTDSRGRTTTASTTISVVAYSSPQITAFSAFRSNSNGSANPQGTYIRITGSSSISSIDSTNTRSTILRYRLKGATTWTNAATNTTSYTPSLAATIPADANSSFEVQIYAIDYFSSASQTTNIGTAFVLMDFHQSGNSMAIGKVAEGRGLIEFGGGMTDIYFNGNRLIDVLQTKFVVSRGVGLASWRKIAEMTTEIASGANRFSALVDGLGDFASASACIDLVSMSTRGNYPTCVCKRLMTGSILNNASFGVRNNTTTGLSELWIRMAPYNYEVHVMVLTAQNTMGIIRWGNLDSTNTEPTGITYITPV